MKHLKNKTILITGGTGTFGQAFISELLKYKVKKVIIFSRDEFKQFVMQQKFIDNRIRYFIGDIRDKDRLYRAFDGVDIVVHAAALKQVPACEYNPDEAVKTNAIGAMNIVNAAIDCGVSKVVALSTDKAVNPVNLYGATKTVMEKIFINGNVYNKDKDKTMISLVRYGNVSGSRGSVIPFFKRLKEQGETRLPLTHIDMTRFHIELQDAVNIVLHAIKNMKGGEIFIPKIPSFKVVDLIKNLGCNYYLIGIRQGEKIHETLISNDEADHCYDAGKYYVLSDYKSGKKVGNDFKYYSGKNETWLYQN